MYCRHFLIAALIIIISGVLNSNVAKTFSYAATVTFYQIMLFLLPTAIISLFLRQSKNLIGKLLMLNYGYKSYMFFASIGTPIHEISHAIFCVIFRHKILEMKLFKPDRDGSLGYVSHIWNFRSAYQSAGSFFIGVAPLILGSALLVIFVHLIGAGQYFDGIAQYSLTELFTGFVVTFKKVFMDINNYKNLYFYIYLILLVAIGSHLGPSASDLRGATYGSVIIVIYLIAANSIFSVSNWLISKTVFLIYLQNILLQALSVNTIIAIFLSIGTLAKKILFQHRSNIYKVKGETDAICSTGKKR